MNSLRSTAGSTSASLVRRIQESDPAAWLRLTELYGPLIYHWVRTAGLQPADTSDVVQEIFLAVAKGVARFEPTENGRFRGWLRTISQNKVRDHFRRKRAEPAAEGGTDAQRRWGELSEPRIDDDVDFGSRLLVRSVLSRIEIEFESKTWRAFWRTTVDRQRPADVAQDLGLSTASVYQAKSRVLRRLRSELTDLL